MLKEKDANNIEQRIRHRSSSRWSGKALVTVALLPACAHSFLPEEEAWGLCKPEPLQGSNRTGLWAALPVATGMELPFPLDTEMVEEAAMSSSSHGHNPMGALCWHWQVLHQRHELA